MAIQNGYSDLPALKARLGVADTKDDAVLEQVIEAASRQIDGLTNRRFYAGVETRHYTAEWGDLLFVDDLISVTTLKTDEDGDRVYETTWAATDFDLEPFNASLLGGPSTQIRTTPNGLRSFPTIRRGVEIAGDWGYAATAPDAIVEATLIVGTRLFQRKHAPYGIAGSAELGQVQLIPRMDPDVVALIAPYRRFAIGAV